LKSRRQPFLDSFQTETNYGGISGDQYFLGALVMARPTRVDFEFVAQAEVVTNHADDVESLSFVNGRPDYVRACCDASLNRLGVKVSLPHEM
jgi:aryl-alcohol dehydrogenase-like predicted oxidoreductase